MKSSPDSPEPNGYLHIGHIKSIALNSVWQPNMAGGATFAWMTPTPRKRRWSTPKRSCEISAGSVLTGRNEYHASDYYQQLYEIALHLIETGQAFICELDPDEMREYAHLDRTGKNSPYRDRPIEENLRIFKEMKAANTLKAPTCCGRKSTWPVRT